MERFLRMTAAEAGAALKPSLVDGKWKRPLLSGRKAALVKKQAARNGMLGQWVPGEGGWLEAWDRPQKHHVMRPPKGHLNQRNEFDRHVVYCCVCAVLARGRGGPTGSLMIGVVLCCVMDSVKKVQAALEAMPAKIAEHKKAVKAAKPLKGLDKWLNESDPY